VLQNIEAVAKELEVAPNSIRNWFTEKVLPGLPGALAKENPGPKPKSASVPERLAQGKRA
jgi:hypothetical protein